MNDSFSPEEKLYRVVRDEPSYIKEDGSLSSASFKQKGLSVDRQDKRTDLEAVLAFQSRGFHGEIFSVFVQECTSVGAYVCYLPLPENRYHSQIYKDSLCDNSSRLTNHQARHLASVACRIEVTLSR